VLHRVAEQAILAIVTGHSIQWRIAEQQLGKSLHEQLLAKTSCTSDQIGMCKLLVLHLASKALPLAVLPG
jgi:inorganic triphosphatase YgiF